MYYPPSQIQTNLYTGGGEYIIASSGENYIGNYYSLYNGTFFTGKNPNDKPNRKLIIANNQSTLDKDDPELGNQGAVSGNTSIYTLPNVYTRKTKLNLGSKPPSAPREIMVTPTKEQYENGEYQRYFLRKENELKFIEVDQTQFRQYVEQQPNVNFQLYTPFKLTWVIRGDRSKVFNENKAAVSYLEDRVGIRGFKSYFNKKFDQYFKYTSGEILNNLETDGTEYKIEKTGKLYKGLYHIHPDKGPMVGAKHISRPHDFLIPIKDNIQIRQASNTSVRRSYRTSGGY